MQRQKIVRLINPDTIRNFLAKHKDFIKTAALPMVIGFAVLFFWFYGSGEEPEIKDNAEVPSMESAEAAGESGNTNETGGGGGSGEIFVDIDGAVKKPGVYKVSEGTRLFQVIELAGGLADNASTDSLNRAETVYDGQKITVYSSEGEIPVSEDPKESSNGTLGGKVNINYADSVTLQTIPGIGPSKAARIIEYRQAQGRFKKIEDIKNVTGIGDMTFENIKDYITV